MARNRTTFVFAVAATWFGVAPAQDGGDAQAPLLLPPASTTTGNADEATPAPNPAGPDLIPPAPAAAVEPEDAPEPVPVRPAPAVRKDVPSVRLQPGERVVPAEQIIRQRRPAGVTAVPLDPSRETNFRPVAPPAAPPMPASGAEYQIDDAVRQATRNLAIDDETRSRYRLNGDEWWFLARSGKWMYFRDGAWQEFDPQTYRPPGAAVTAGGTAAPGGSAIVPLAGQAPGPYPAGRFSYGPGPYQGGPFPDPGFQPYPGSLVPADMDRGDLRRAERRARQGGGVFGWLRD